MSNDQFLPTRQPYAPSVEKNLPVLDASTTVASESPFRSYGETGSAPSWP